MKEKFISDLDLVKMPKFNMFIEIRLYLGIEVKKAFSYERDYKRMGFIIKYN